tara:strand:+ start:450 stop:806 length:357 start_codon:yes stop_codon:yes gene_type:complete
MTNKFDIDLRYGQIFEAKLSHIFKDKKVEVKTERDHWRKTGNIAIEYECRGKKSGISVTEADWWCHVLADGNEVNSMLMMPTDKMKSLARKYYKNKKKGGDDNASKFVLIPLKEMFNE